MEFLELSILRIVMLVLYNILAVTFLIAAIRIFKRSKGSQQTNYIVKFFLYVAISLIINAIYAPMKDEIVQKIGNNTVILLTTMGIANLMLFALSIRYSSLILTKKKSLIIESSIFLISLVFYIIPNGTTFLMPDYSPKWSTEFIIFGLILTQVQFIIAYEKGLFEVKFENSELKKRLQMFMLGVVFSQLLVIFAFLGNAQLINDTIRVLSSLCIFPSAILIYYSVGRPL